MSEVKKSVGPWKSIRKFTRRKKAVVNRLRAGHTQLTHGYLRETNGPRVLLICQYCDDAIITVKHLLLQCPALQNERNNTSVFREKINVSLKDVIGEEAPIDKVLQFLRRIDVFNKI